MSATWKFLLTDLAGNVLGELLNADNRQVVLPLNRIPTAAFNVRADHPLGTYLTDPNFDGYLKCYRNGTLIYIGYIVTSEEAYDTQTGVQRLQVTSAGPLWRYSYRLLGISSTGFQASSTATPGNLGDIFNFTLETVLNSATGGSTGFDGPYSGVSFGGHSVTATGAVGTYFFKPFTDALAEAAVGTFDFVVNPTEPTNIGHTQPKIGELWMYDIIGQTRPEVVLEFGSPGANLAQYGRIIDRSNLVTRGYIQQPAASDHSGTLSSFDTTASQARGWYEGLIDDGGVQWNVLRQNLVNQAVALRRQARQVISFQPKPDCPYSALDDYQLGDTVQVISELNGNIVLDAGVRIWGVTFDIDKNNNEQQTLQTVDES